LPLARQRRCYRRARARKPRLRRRAQERAVFVARQSLAPRGLTCPPRGGVRLRRRNHARSKGSHVTSYLSRGSPASHRGSSVARSHRKARSQSSQSDASCVRVDGAQHAEGSRSQGGNKRVRYFNSLGSTREVLACLEVGAALGYVAPPTPALIDRFNHVIGTLVSPREVIEALGQRPRGAARAPHAR